MSKTMNIPVFIPHNGCPNDCVFCNQRKISGVKESEQLEEVRMFIEDSIKSAGNRKDIEIAFFGGSFTGLELEIQKSYLDMGTEFVNKYKLKGIRMSTRPDYITTEIMEFLKPYPVSSIELGVQSLNEKVLIATKRNHSIEDVKMAVKLIKETKIELGLQMMIGLPFDRIEYVKETLDKIIGFDPKTVRIYPTLVIKDTELEQLYLKGLYKPLSVEEAVEQVALILPEFIKHNITVLRVGLQANEGLNSGDFIAGPYHPAFKELVMDRIIYNEVLDQYSILRGNYINTIEDSEKLDSKPTLSANRKIYNRLIGHQKINKIAFEEYGFILLCDESVKKDLIQIRSIQGSAVFTFRF